MISYCSNSSVGYFSTMSGHGVTKGLCLLHAATLSGTPCERYGEEMTREEAQAEGIRQGFLIAFRETNSFYNLAAHFLLFYGEGREFIALCEREEMDKAAVIATCKRMKLIAEAK